MKPVKAWMKVDKYGRPLVYDHRLPMFWLRGPARNDTDGYDPDNKMVRVEIREVPKKRREP